MIDHPRRHFFDDEKRFAAGEVSYDILHEGVRLKRRSLITGSCTPIYTYWKPAMERISKYHPGIKLIGTASESDRPRILAMEHEPRPATGDHGISRSHRGGAESKPGRASSTAAPDFVSGPRILFRTDGEGLSLFPTPAGLRDQVRESSQEHAGGGQWSIRFPGSSAFGEGKERRTKSNPHERRISSEERRNLYRFYEEDIARLEKLLKWDCSDWKQV